MEFVNFFTATEMRPRACIEPFVLMLAPLAPHIAEELWQALGHTDTLAYAPWPEADERFTREDMVELPVQVNGRLRGHVTAPAGAGNAELERAAFDDPAVRKHIEGKTVRKVIVVPGKLINIVVS
jgi:leucyl-tRNA synthetase